MKLKKMLALSLATISVIGLASCGDTGDAASTGSKAEGKKYIAIVSKGFQHQFWQVVKKGADDAAKKYGVEITFDGPPTESDINTQVDQLRNAMNKNPSAIALAALSTDSVKELLNECKTKKIPVVGFDSGVPDAPAGSIYATASTDNYNAAVLAAENLFAEAKFQSKLTSVAKPVIAVLSQDATSDSIVKRTSGFIDTMYKKLDGMSQFAGGVEVVGHDTFKKSATGGTAKVTIQVNVPASTSAADMKSGADTLLALKNVIAIYGSNENGAGGILSASNDGSDFATTGKYKDILAVGFDAGKNQRTAVEKGWFLGSITQDPYQIGYKAVELAVEAINGKAAASEIVDTGAKWYNAEALADPAISQLVYE